MIKGETEVRELCKWQMPLVWTLGEFLTRKVMGVSSTTAPA